MVHLARTKGARGPWTKKNKLGSGPLDHVIVDFDLLLLPNARFFPLLAMLQSKEPIHA